MTKVEECTNALTGVGAAIAAGNQELKGYWALFVNPANIKISTKGKIQELNGKLIKENCPRIINRKVESTIKASPIRLIIKVWNPALKESCL